MAVSENVPSRRNSPPYQTRSQTLPGKLSGSNTTDDGGDDEALVGDNSEDDDDYKDEADSHSSNESSQSTTVRGQDAGQQRVPKTLAKLRATIQALKQEKKEMEATMAQMRIDFNEAETHMLQQIKQSVYHELPDNVIKDEFRQLIMACTGWVKDWSTSNLSAIQDERLYLELSKLLLDHGDPHPDLLLTRARLEDRKFCRIILLAILLTTLMEHLFTSPFKTWSTLRLNAVSRNFDDVYQQFKKGISVPHLKDVTDTLDLPHETQAWRTTTMRLLETLLQSTSTSANFARLLTARCASLSEKNIQQYTGRYLKRRNDSEHDKCQAELQAIYERAARLSINLWSRDSEVHVCRNGEIFQQPFSIASNIYEAHSSMGLDGNDMRYEEERVHLVITPLIFSTSGHDTKVDLGKAKIWHKALVLICDGFEIAQATVRPEEAQTLQKRCIENSTNNGQRVKRQKIEQHSPPKSSSDRSVPSELARSNGPEQEVQSPMKESPHRTTVEQLCSHRNEAQSYVQLVGDLPYGQHKTTTLATGQQVIDFSKHSKRLVGGSKYLSTTADAFKLYKPSSNRGIYPFKAEAKFRREEARQTRGSAEIDHASDDISHDDNNDNDCQEVQNPDLTLAFQQSRLSTHNFSGKVEDGRSATE